MLDVFYLVNKNIIVFVEVLYVQYLYEVAY